MKQLISFLWIFFSLYCCPAQGAEPLPQNSVRVGKCVVRGSVPKSAVGKISVSLSGNEFYTEAAKVVELQVDALGNLIGEFPMETRYEFAGVKLRVNNSEYQQSIVLSQDDTLQIVVSKNEPLTIKGTIESNLVKNDLLFNYVLAVEDHNEEFVKLPSRVTALHHQKNVLKQLSKLLSVSGKNFFHGVSNSDKKFLENWGKLNLLESQLLVPVRTQREVPKSYWDFLNQLQWDNQLLYNNKGLAAMIAGLLRTPSLAIPEIGETPIEVWSEGVKKAFQGSSFAPNSFFCELLAFSSYQEQALSGKPLTEVQMKNIKSGFKTQNWGSLLIKRN